MTFPTATLPAYATPQVDPTLPPVTVRWRSSPDGDRIVSLRGLDASCDLSQVWQLLDGLGAESRSTQTGRRPERVRIDGIAVRTDRTALDHLREGCLVEADLVDPVSTMVDSGPWELAWETGPDAGIRRPVWPGYRAVIGRSPGADAVIDDPQLAAHHCTVTVDEQGDVRLRHFGFEPTADDADDRWTVGEARKLGSGIVRLRPTSGPSTHTSASDRSADRATPWKDSVIRRRLEPVGDEPVIDTPERAALDAAPDHTLAFVTMGVTAIGGIAAALIFGQVAMLALVAVGCVGGIASTVVGGSRARRTQRRQSAVRASELAVFVGALHAAHATATSRARNRLTVDDLESIRRHGERGVSRLWHHRSEHSVPCTLGRGDVPWTPSLSRTPERSELDLWAALQQVDALADVPIGVSIDPGDVIALVGDAAATLAALNAAVLTAAVAAGPSSLRLEIDGATGQTSAEWRDDSIDGLRWLPHVNDAVSEPSVKNARALVLHLASADDLASPTSDLRRRLADPDGTDAVVVLVRRHEQVPASCTKVVTIAVDGGITIDSGNGVAIRGRLAGVPARRAEQTAAAMARLEDPECHATDRRVPATLDLLDLTDRFDAGAAAAVWRRNRRHGRPRATLGMSAEGPLQIDLVDDGPHALIVGTTGAGKSELLRTLVLGLAVESAPDELTFVLVDYKGGSAFDRCAGLPHVAGIVTDLDERLAERVLRSLDAELTRRERVLRSAGAGDIEDYHQARRAAQTDEDASAGTLPRLVLVIDEFAALAAELPDFLASLVGIAQRGRSLGMHLVLATQRPSAALNDDIRANTNLRIALRVHDTADSVEVIGDPSAAALARSLPGRAILRLGAGELVQFQAARCTGSTRLPGRAIEQPTAVMLDRYSRSTRLAAEHRTRDRADDQAGGATSGLRTIDAVVSVLATAHERSGGVPVPRPWVDPLPDVLRHTSRDGEVGVIDDPDGQRHVPLQWSSGQGHLVVAGSAGSGVSSTLATVAHVASTGHVCTHVYVLDAGGGTSYDSLAGQPHVGAVVRAADTDRRSRLLAALVHTIDQRTASATTEPPLLVVIDGLVAIRNELMHADDPTEFEHLERVVNDGLAAGVTVAAGCDQPSALPLGFLSRATERWVLRLADSHEAVALGARASQVPEPSAPPGRGVIGAGPLAGCSFQVLSPTAVTAEIEQLRSGCDGRCRPAPVNGLPAEVAFGDLPATTLGASGALIIPLGVDHRDLSIAEWELLPGDHALIVGSRRSGRTSTLRSIAATIGRTGNTVRALWLAGRSVGPESIGYGEIVDLDALVTLADDARASGQNASQTPTVVLIDDADAQADAHGLLRSIVEAPPACWWIVAAARTDSVRAGYGHWLQTVRISRTGVLLGEAVLQDQDLFGSVTRRKVSLRSSYDALSASSGSLALIRLASAMN